MTQAHIMVVDDNPANLKLLETMLSDQLHEVHAFPLGRLALAAAARQAPDLILLDINMPEMDGYEVCARLKANPALARIPVIFLSALNDTPDKVKAFRAGAADYISKPFQFEEIQARVETHLSLYRQNQRLEQAVAERTRELAEANTRLQILDRSKNDFLRLISHEFRTPLNGVLGVGELMLMGSDPEGLRGMFQQSRDRLMTILDDAMLLTQIDVQGDGFQLQPVLLRDAIASAQAKVADLAESRGVTIAIQPMNGDRVLAEESLLARALCALLETAVKFSAKGEAVKLSHQAGKLVFESRGKTIPEALLPKFFDLFTISDCSTAAGELGLGPALANRILSLFGAAATVENLSPAGVQLTIALKFVG